MFRIFIFGATLASIRETQLYFSILADGPRATISVSEALCLRVRSLSVLRVRVITKVLQDYVLLVTPRLALSCDVRSEVCLRRVKPYQGFSMVMHRYQVEPCSRLV